MLGAGWEGRLGCRGWLAGGLPLVGKQLSKVALGMAADASEEVAEVGALKRLGSWSKAFTFLTRFSQFYWDFSI